MTSKWDLIVIGGGAAGLMCAYVAGQRGQRVLLLEHMHEVAKKILISGGGRCNFTNLYTSPDNYLSENPHFCKSALARYSPRDFLDLVESHGIAWYEKKLGQLFCKGSSREIVELLLAECRDAGVAIRTGVRVHAAARDEQGFRVETHADTLRAKRLVLACGGLSIPKVGASDLGYRLLKHFGHAMIAARPGLVPLTLHPRDQALTELRGISLDTRVSCGEASFRENMLFTHFGLSGPAILQVSSYWQPGQQLDIDFLPDLDLIQVLRAEAIQHPEQQLQTWLKTWLPQRWLQFWGQHYALSKTPLRQLNTPETAFRPLQHWQIQPAGTAGYGKAEVTLGGADTREFSSRTMESRKVPGLFCIGELMDVTGWLGGYNFQWAWASAQAAGTCV
ncbi:MAG: NAD(P)/FAD-dependent oxidoreductase [Candidatus Sericytochromatia bacterium]